MPCIAGRVRSLPYITLSIHIEAHPGCGCCNKGEKEKMNRKYRTTVIAGNWKMNKTPSETKEFMTQLKAIMPKGRWCDVAL